MTSLRRFRHDLRRGLGSALLTLQNSGAPEQYAEAVRWACLHNTTYDYQSNGGKGWYLHQAARFTGQAESIEADVIDAYLRCPPDGWRIEYLQDILVHFALAGSAHSRGALWDQYARLMTRFARSIRRDEGCMWTPESVAEELVAVDGFEVVRTAISDFGDCLASQPDNPSRERWLYFPEWFHSDIRERFGEERVEAVLAGSATPGVRAYAETRAEYLAAQERIRQTHEAHPDAAVTPENVADMVERARRGDLDPRQIHYAVIRGFRVWDGSAIETVARMGLSETDPEIKGNLLSTFGHRGFPLPDDELGPLVDSDNDMLRGAVREILGQRAADWKRSHALDLLERGREVEEALDLLVASYKPEDEPVVYRAIRRMSWRHDEWHTAYAGVETLLKPADRPVTTEVLSFVYRKNLCSGCRRRTLKLMHDKGVLPAEIVRECHWDSSEDIRELAAQWGGGDV